MVTSMSCECTQLTCTVEVAGDFRRTRITCAQCGQVWHGNAISADGRVLLGRERRAWREPQLKTTQVKATQPAKPPRKAKVVTTAEGEQLLRAELGEGVGTALAIRFFRMGVPSCQACKDLARRMNAWGVAGCREHRDEIVADMLPRFREWVAAGKPWAGKLLSVANVVGVGDAAARVAIRAYVGDVIDEYERAEAKMPATSSSQQPADAVPR